MTLSLIQALPHYGALSLFQKTLLATDGTVTDLLALYAGVPIRAQKLAQSIQSCEATADVPSVLSADPRVPILHREIVLMAGDRALLHAESFFVFDRFSRTTQTALLESETPIGYLWQRERTEMYREVVAVVEAPHAPAARALGVDLGRANTEPLVSRSYVIHTQGQPLGMITERFLVNGF